jgi:hypothetical protein
MTTDALSTPLSIGQIVGGSDEASDTWRTMIAALSRSVREARAGVVSPVALNVVYHVPGPLLRPDFTGVRTGRSTRTPPGLMVQIAIPVGIPAREVSVLDGLDQASTLPSSGRGCAATLIRYRKSGQSRSARGNIRRVAGTYDDKRSKDLNPRPLAPTTSLRKSVRSWRILRP